MTYNNQRGMSLVGVALFSMLVAVLGMGSLFYMRYGHLPMQDTWARWGKSANVIGKEIKNAAGLPNSSGSDVATGASDDQGMRQAATTSEGVRRCNIEGKTVYSDTLCLDNNPSTRKVKLSDSAGMVPPKAAVVTDDVTSGGAAHIGNAGIPGSTANQELKKKIMEQALGKAAAASNADEQDLHFKMINKAIDKATK